MPASANSLTVPDTIYALSSGRPPAAIAVVRISGPQAGVVLEALAGRIPAPRHATLATLRDEAGDPLDRALALWFPGPASATGEDLAELYLHGGIAVVDATLATLARSGLRLAEPGEFTRRALLNGRLDLAEVEGLADLLTAETERQRREALSRADGALGRKLRGWADAIVGLAARIEAAIDYDGDAEVAHDPSFADDLAALTNNIAAALAVPPAERLRDGVRVAIVGPVNAGKSSLFNALIGADAAIVSDRPGTTRDLIERPLSLAGIPIVLIDTAGLRDADDDIERIGIERAEHAAETADLLLDLSSDGIADTNRIIVASKSDLIPPRVGAIGVSSKTGKGLRALVAEIAARAAMLLPQEGEVALNRRYREGLAAAQAALANAGREDDMLFVAERLRAARHEIDRLVGGADIETMLDALFGRFCLGK